MSSVSRWRNPDFRGSEGYRLETGRTPTPAMCHITIDQPYMDAPHSQQVKVQIWGHTTIAKSL